MLTLDEIESGLFVTHKNTGLRYSVVEAEDGEVLLSPEQDGLQDLTVPLDLFRNEFVNSERFRAPGGRRGGRGRRETRYDGSYDDTYDDDRRGDYQDADLDDEERRGLSFPWRR